MVAFVAFLALASASSTLVGRRAVGAAVDLQSLDFETHVTTRIDNGASEPYIQVSVVGLGAGQHAPALSEILQVSGTTYTLTGFKVDGDTSGARAAAPTLAIVAAAALLSSFKPGIPLATAALVAGFALVPVAHSASPLSYEVVLGYPPGFVWARVTARLAAGGTEFAPLNASMIHTGICAAHAAASTPVPDSTVSTALSLESPTLWQLRTDSALVVPNRTLDGFSTTIPAWSPPRIWLATVKEVPKSFAPGVVYTASIAWRQAANNSYNGVLVSNSSVLSLQLVLSAGPLPSSGNGISSSALSSAAVRVNVSMGSAPLGGNRPEFTVTTVTFTVPSLLVRPYMYFRFLLAGSSAGSAPDVLFFGPISVTAPPMAATSPAVLQTGVSEVAIIPRAPAVPVVPASQCPHLQPGLRRWEDPATWGGAVPTAGANVTLPDGVKVLVSGCSFLPGGYTSINVPATSELIFNDHDIVLTVASIYVQGRLWMGSSTCRLSAKIQVTFTGAKTPNDLIAPGCGAKGLCVARSGQIDAHGKLFDKSWTRLAASGEAGDDRLYLQDAVNWEAGQNVVVVTTVYKDEYDPQNEVRTVKGVSADGLVVQLTSPLVFSHYAGPEYQAEVGLLSRNIVFQGDESSENSTFGGHVLVRGQGRFSGVQGYRMGQRNMMARYPFHFHLTGASPESYATDCSVFHSFFRCFTIHGASQITLERNVAFDVSGNCFYLEDGVEENNTIAFNLAAFVHTIGRPAAGAAQVGELFNETSDLIIPADTTAAGFYSTNTYNRWIGNAASGGWSGFGFPNLPLPIGQYANEPIVPMERPLLQFEGNTAHSSGYFWGDSGCIYSGGRLAYNPGLSILQYSSGRLDRNTKLPGGTPVWMQFNNTKVFLCGKGLNHWGQRAELLNFEAHDSFRAATTFGESWVSNALINGESANPVPYTGGTTQGFQFYDTFVKTILTRVTFRNLRATGLNYSDPTRDNCGIISMTHSDEFKPQGISATRALTFENVDFSRQMCHYPRETGSSRMFNFVDYDGTAIGRPGTPTIIGSHLSWWNLAPDCFYSVWGVWLCDKLPGREIINMQIYIPGVIVDGVTDSTALNYEVGRLSLFGQDMTPGRSLMVTRNPGVTGAVTPTVGWYLYMVNGSAQSTTFQPGIVPNGARLVLAVPYPSGTNFTIKAVYRWNNRYSFNLTAASSIGQVVASNGTVFYFDGTNLYLNIKLLTPVNANESWSRDGVTIYDVQSGWRYIVTAQCPSTQALEPGRCDPTPEALPPPF